MTHEDGTFKAVTVDSHKAIYCTSLLIIFLILLGIVAALLCSKCKRKLQGRSTVAASPAESPENEMVPPSFLYINQSSGMRQCLGCRSTIKVGEMVQELPICKHLFHANCLSTWLQSNSTCPLCQSNIHPPDEIIKGSSSEPA